MALHIFGKRSSVLKIIKKKQSCNQLKRIPPTCVLSLQKLPTTPHCDDNTTLRLGKFISTYMTAF